MDLFDRLRPEEAEPATPGAGGPVWIVLATDRRPEFHAPILACGPNGGVRRTPPYAEFPVAAAAWAEVTRWRSDLVLEDWKYTYTPFWVE